MQYQEQIKQPIDLTAILDRVNGNYYRGSSQFLDDISTISSAEKEYWKDNPSGVKFIDRACALEDEAAVLVAANVPEALQEKLEAMFAKGGPAPRPSQEPEYKNLYAEGKSTGENINGSFSEMGDEQIDASGSISDTRGRLPFRVERDGISRTKQTSQRTLQLKKCEAFTSLQNELATCTAGLSLDALEELQILLQNMIFDNRHKELSTEEIAQLIRNFTKEYMTQYTIAS